MLRKIWLISLISLLLNGCDAPEVKDAPKVTVFISMPEGGGMDYYDANAQVSGFLTYEQTDHFVCFKPDDAKKIFDYYVKKTKSN